MSVYCYFHVGAIKKISLVRFPLGVKCFVKIHHGLVREAGLQCSRSVDVSLKYFQEMFLALLVDLVLDVAEVHVVPLYAGH